MILRNDRLGHRNKSNSGRLEIVSRCAQRQPARLGKAHFIAFPMGQNPGDHAKGAARGDIKTFVNVAAGEDETAQAKRTRLANRARGISADRLPLSRDQIYAALRHAVP